MCFPCPQGVSKKLSERQKPPLGIIPQTGLVLRCIVSNSSLTCEVGSRADGLELAVVFKDMGLVPDTER